MPRATAEQLSKWCQLHGLTLDQARHLRRLCLRFADYQTKAHNGDPYQYIPKTADKEAHSKEWQKLADSIANKINESAKAYGLDSVCYDDGLYPAFTKGTHRFTIPD